MDQRTTAFTNAVLSAQIVPPVAGCELWLRVLPQELLSIRCVLNICSLDNVPTGRQEGRTDTEVGVSRVCKFLGYGSTGVSEISQLKQLML